MSKVVQSWGRLCTSMSPCAHKDEIKLREPERDKCTEHTRATPLHVTSTHDKTAVVVQGSRLVCMHCTLQVI